MSSALHSRGGHPRPSSKRNLSETRVHRKVSSSSDYERRSFDGARTGEGKIKSKITSALSKYCLSENQI